MTNYVVLHNNKSITDRGENIVKLTKNTKPDTQRMQEPNLKQLMTATTKKTRFLISSWLCVREFCSVSTSSAFAFDLNLIPFSLQHHRPSIEIWTLRVLLFRLLLLLLRFFLCVAGLIMLRIRVFSCVERRTVFLPKSI